MKHTSRVTLFLVMLFFSAQVFGLFLLNQSIEKVNVSEDGAIEVVYTEPVTGRPELEGSSSFTYILAMILIGTMILLLLIRFKLFKIWKAWFFLAIWGSLVISLDVLLPLWAAAVAAMLLTYLKLYRPDVFVHNLSEVLMYGGIAILISPLFNVFWGVLLLIAISIYDMIAVWKLKHMVTLAKAQTEEKMFAGLLIPYSLPKKDPKISVKNPEKDLAESKISDTGKIHLKIPKGIKTEGVKSAILGGGDIAFPMMFAGSVMTSLIMSGIDRYISYFMSLIIALSAAGGLSFLFYISKKDKFYPAMPFISAGCFIGYGIVYLIAYVF